MDESVIGSSKASQKLAQQVRQTATDLKPVILQAPPGSGKTFFAGLIHGNSGLKNPPFALPKLTWLNYPNRKTVS